METVPFPVKNCFSPFIILKMPNLWYNKHALAQSSFSGRTNPLNSLTFLKLEHKLTFSRRIFLGSKGSLILYTVSKSSCSWENLACTPTDHFNINLAFLLLVKSILKKQLGCILVSFSLFSCIKLSGIWLSQCIASIPCIVLLGSSGCLSRRGLQMSLARQF